MGIKIEGEPPKRYGSSYGGEVIGSFDTATEILEAYKNHRDLIRPVTDRKGRFRYQFWEGRNDITIEVVRLRAATENK